MLWPRAPTFETEGIQATHPSSSEGAGPRVGREQADPGFRESPLHGSLLTTESTQPRLEMDTMCAHLGSVGGVVPLPMVLVGEEWVQLCPCGLWNPPSRKPPQL